MSGAVGSTYRPSVNWLTRLYTRTMAPESRPVLDREQALLDVVASIMSQASLGDLVRDLTEKLSLGRHIESYLDRAAEYDRRISER